MSSTSTTSEGQEPKNGLLERFIDTSKPHTVEGISIKLYLVIAVLAIAILELDILNQTGVTGAYAVLWAIGFLFFAIGERVRILKALLGGGLVVAWAGAASISRAGLISPEDVNFIQGQMIGNGFLFFVMAGLIISNVLSVQPAILKKSLVSFAPIILGGLIFAALGGIVAGILVGIPMNEVITMYFLPIMGGGAGAGALPMSEVFADVTGQDASVYFNHAIGVLTLSNIAAILIASFFVQIEGKFQSLSGGGQLVKSGDQQVAETEPVAESDINTHGAMFCIAGILLTSMVISSFTSLHFFAWVTILSVILNISGLVSLAMQASLRKLSGWVMQAFLATVLTAFGLTADFDVILALFSFANLLIIVAIVIGAAFGAGFTAYFVKCYPLEASLTGGLCMADAGGSGDLQVLSAARRIQLYPYSQLSTRIGGAFVLILGSYLFQILS